MCCERTSKQSIRLKGTRSLVVDASDLHEGRFESPHRGLEETKPQGIGSTESRNP